MRRRTRVFRRIFSLTNIGALVLVVCTAAPLYWLVSGALKPVGQLSAVPPTLVPTPPSLANFQSAFVDYHFGTYLLNSAIVALSSTAIVLALATFAGYSLGRLPMRGKFHIMVALLMISLFPTIAVVSPLYVLMRELGWLNSYHGLVVPYVAFNLPFAIWIIRNYMLGVPRSMEESAYIDGAGPVRTLLTVILPQVRPALFTAGIFTFAATWTEFLFALTFNSEDSYRTVPVGIALFGELYTVPYGTIFAASVAALAPIAILVLVFRRLVVAGLSEGAVKG